MSTRWLSALTLVLILTGQLQTTPAAVIATDYHESYTKTYDDNPQYNTPNATIINTYNTPDYSPPIPATVESLGLTFSTSGAAYGKYCISMNEPDDPNGWSDNFLCFNKEYSVRWFTSHPPKEYASMVCTKVHELDDPHGWTDNFLCVPSDSKWKFVYSSQGPIPGKSGILLNEPQEPYNHCWTNNYLGVEGFMA